MGRIDIRIGEDKKVFWVSEAEKRGLTLTQFVHTAIDEYITRDESASDFVHTNRKDIDMEGILSVHTKDKVISSGFVSLGGLQNEIEEAIVMGDRENWSRVKELIRDMGYGWDTTTQELSKDGRVIYRAKSRT